MPLLLDQAQRFLPVRHWPVTGPPPTAAGALVAALGDYAEHRAHFHLDAAPRVPKVMGVPRKATIDTTRAFKWWVCWVGGAHSFCLKTQYKTASTSDCSLYIAKASKECSPARLRIAFATNWILSCWVCVGATPGWFALETLCIVLWCCIHVVSMLSWENVCIRLSSDKTANDAISNCEYGNLVWNSIFLTGGNAMLDDILQCVPSHMHVPLSYFCLQDEEHESKLCQSWSNACVGLGVRWHAGEGLC